MDNARSFLLEAQNVSKIYGNHKAKAAEMMLAGVTKAETHSKTGATVALWDVSLKVRRGEIFVIIGLSGSGKSTLLRTFNRLITPTSGAVLYDGVDLGKMTKKELLLLRRERISMIFQHFGLFTHRNVLDNVAYGLEVRGVAREERSLRAMRWIEMVGLEGLEKSSISSLSGGMKQRVGIARALASDPEVLLMDEPFSALDPLVRRDMQFELLSIQRKLNKTIIFITHDINEAFKLGDTVVIMRDGKVVQTGPPESISTHPSDEYVRHFVEGADRTQVLTARHVMVTPTSFVRETTDAVDAIREMRKADVSSAYVVDNSMRLKGVLTLDGALSARSQSLPISEFIDKNPVTTTEDVLLCDIMPLTVEMRYPIAVLAADGTLKGIVSKAAVIASLI